MEGSERRLTTDDLAADPDSMREEVRREERRAEPIEPDASYSRESEGDDRSREGHREASDSGASASGSVLEAQPLFAGAEASELRERWDSIQTGFVDEPRRAVEQADALVADLMQRLASVFSDERKSLEGQWDRGDDVSTEDLRVALQRYRSFFDRLLSA